MRMLFHAGLVAAKVQMIVALGISIAVVMILGPGHFPEAVSSTSTDATLPLEPLRLAWADILSAFCIAVFNGRHVEATAEALSRGLRRIDPENPHRLATSLLAQLSLASIGLAILALKQGPSLVSDIAAMLGLPGCGAILWPAITSIGIAAFGANAHAAALARSRLSR